MNPVEVTRGNGPIVLGLPHTGTHVDAAIGVLLNRNGRQLADADWHIDRLYSGLRTDVTTVRATFHRYVIDANRDPEGQSLYPGQNTTGLVPATDFDGHPIWDRPITDAETQGRLAQYHAPYHSALQAEMERVRARHGVAILFDAHSIRSQIPFLFKGILPDLNLGTNDGTSCDATLSQAVATAIKAPGYSSVVDGRFKGGWSTRHYGRPREGWHALQMEIAQSAYLEAEAPPWRYDSEKAGRLRPILADCMNNINDSATTLKVTS